MKIDFTISDSPPIYVRITRDAFTGRFTCVANGNEYEIRSPFDPGTHFTFALTHNYTVELPGRSPHLIEVEHTRPQWLAGFRPQRYVVKVDGAIVADKTGY